jgi:hypothetical protein
MVVNHVEFTQRRIDNLRSAFGAMSILIGSVLGYLISSGLEKVTPSWTSVFVLFCWFLTIALAANGLLKSGENVIWHVPLKEQWIPLFTQQLPAFLLGLNQQIVPINARIWVALYLAWFFSTALIALLERPKVGEWND